jgi:hypothetical protein
MVVPLAEESEDEPVQSSVDALKKQFLSGAADKVIDSDEPEKE